MAKDFLISRALGFYAFDLFLGVSGYSCDHYNFKPTYCHRYQICMASVAAAAETVENTVESKYRRCPGAARLCLYKKHDGSGTAAIWADKGYYFKPASADLTVADMMGNLLRPDQKGRYKLDQEPILIRGAKYEKMAESIDKGEIGQTDFCHIRCEIQQKDLLTVRVENTSTKKDLHLEAEISSEGGKHRKELSVTAGGIRFFTLPYHGSSASVCFKNLDNNSVMKKNFQLKVPIPLGSKPTKFAEVSLRLHLSPNEPWTPWSGPEDLSADFFGSWDDRYLMLEVKARDDRHFNKFHQTYGGDSLQFAIDPKSNAGIQKRGPGVLGNGHIEVGIALSTRTGKKFLSRSYGPADLLSPEDYEVVRDEKAKTTLYRVRIPWAKMGVEPYKGKVFGMSLVLFDDDTDAGQEYHAPIGGGITGGKDPEKFLKFVLE